ncbi:MAG TPA: flagellar biosynthesis protein FlhB [Gammaproteobacteria bacterium]|nr:flagellar biosynthesis protein FlhB [Gammaproteobacteria bacterium]
MAEAASGQERSEEASAKRLAEARERGQIARSRELTTMLLLFAVAAVLWSSGDDFVGAIAASMRYHFDVGNGLRLADVDVLRLAGGALGDAFTSLAPFLLVSALVSVAGTIALGGWNIAPEALGFKWNRIDPIAGIGRLFSARSLAELAKALAKFVLLLGFGLVALWHEAPQLLALGTMPLAAGIASTTALAFKAFLIVSAGTIVIALADVPFQKWEHARQLRMTRQELREEAKESDGSPEVKGKIRSLQAELARRRMMEQVPRADVVVTNPAHYAVALKFDPATMSAPRLVAKGTELVALRIRELALEAGVTVLEAPPLARAVYHTTKLNQEIPAGLYVAVAQVLAYVFQLRKRDPLRPAPPPPSELPIPPELQY